MPHSLPVCTGLVAGVCGSVIHLPAHGARHRWPTAALARYWHAGLAVVRVSDRNADGRVTVEFMEMLHNSHGSL